MEEIWYAVYIDGQIAPTALFLDLADAKSFCAGRKCVIAIAKVDDDANAATGKYLMTVFAPLDPRKTVA